jgi:CSLREA domain-containing protein
MSLALAFAPASFASSDQVFSNATPIVWGTFPTSTPRSATPYPSLINVSGIGGNTITRAKVILRNFQHGYPDDVDLLLEAPDGTRSIVMSDAGGTAAVNGEFPTFSPAAALPVPGNSWIDDAVPQRATNAIDDISGSVADEFPAPGPGTVVAAAADLDAFNGVNPNGNWKLYAVDDYPMLDGGALLEGWSLVLTVPSVFTVTKTADSDDHTCDSDCSLREAIEAAGAGDLIRFSPLFDRAQTITLNGTSLVVSRDMTIAGPGAARLTVSAAGLSRVILTGNNVALSLSGMTITGGRVAEKRRRHQEPGAVVAAERRGRGEPGRGQHRRRPGPDRRHGEYRGLHVQRQPRRHERRHRLRAGGRLRDAAHRQQHVQREHRRRRGGRHRRVQPGPGLASVEIVDSTIAGNRAAVEGGILLYTQGSPDAKIDFTVRNTIIANNLPTNWTREAPPAARSRWPRAATT